ncbi:MAG: peptidylprolyl isomerase [Candidatus Magasanikbacteria bacterium]
MSKNEEKKKNNAKALGLGFILIILLAIVGVYMFSYSGVKKASRSNFVVKSATIFGIPAAKINGQKITYKDYLLDVQSLESFYSINPEQFSGITDEDLSNQALSRLLANKIIGSWAKKLDISVTDEEVNKAVEEIVGEFGSREATEQEIVTQFGWTLDMYIERILRPILLEQKMDEKFAEIENFEEGNSFLQPEVKASHILFPAETEAGEDLERIRVDAEKVLERAKSGEDFAALAKEFGSDSTKDVGGDLGWFGSGIMVPEFEEAAFNTEVGAVAAELVETQFGLHIIKVDDKREARDFSAFMNSQLKDADIKMVADIPNPFEGLFDDEEGSEE